MPVRLGWAVGALLLVAVPAQAMPVREFLARWDKLNKLGEMARLDPDAGKLIQELGGIVIGYRAAVDAAAAAGKPIACPPPKGQAKFESGPLIAHLKALPPAEQDIELKDAVYAFMNQAYPCPSPSSPAGSAAAGTR